MTARQNLQQTEGIEGKGVSCISLLDTGSMVTTISEPFYRENLGHLGLHPVESLLEVTCANGASCLVNLDPNKKKQSVTMELWNISQKDVIIPKGAEVFALQQCHSLVSKEVVEQSVEDEKLLAQGMFDLNNLAEEDRISLQALILKWRSVFSVSEIDVGRTELMKHAIKLTDDTPIKQRHRRIPPAMYSELKQH